MIDLDPRDPKAGAHENPLAQYLTVPNGIGVVAAIQVLIGILFAYTAFRQYQDGAGSALVASLAVPSGLFLIVGVEFWRCRAWAWWALATIFCFLMTTTAADLLRGTGPEVAERGVFLVIALAAEAALLFYIYREFVVRHMSFRRPPDRWLRYSPLLAGIALGVVAIVRRTA